MSKSFTNGLFIFRRDFRTVDNIGLYQLNTVCKNIYAVFIFTPEQITNTNSFKSDNAVQFMIESLEDLSLQIGKQGGKLHTFYGKNEKIILDCIRAFQIDVVCFNVDYTPYAIQRDENIEKLCERMKVKLMCCHDYYLHQPGTILTSAGKPYQKFTPYYESALKQKITPVSAQRKVHFVSSRDHIANTISLREAMDRFTVINPNILVRGGREPAINKLKTALKMQKHYSTNHNVVSKPTSELSAYIKFGCLSIREVYTAFKTNHDFVRQLIWRDFYANLLYSFPYVLGNAMKPNYRKIKWHFKSSWFKAWCNGKTGFPIVDAGMRQLNETGYLHNRARLIVASFLVKTLLISWEHGEKYFAKMLTDYDPASNNGNWQWIASTGADSQPYFRIFNPTEQGKTVDPDCEYIKKWVPELKELEASAIHNWEVEWKDHKTYMKPICDYKVQKEIAMKMYSSIF
jgi:deoxyribodipyrimidine photo-lyase